MIFRVTCPMFWLYEPRPTTACMFPTRCAFASCEKQYDHLVFHIVFHTVFHALPFLSVSSSTRKILVTHGRLAATLPSTRLHGTETICIRLRQAWRNHPCKWSSDHFSDEIMQKYGIRMEVQQALFSACVLFYGCSFWWQNPWMLPKHLPKHIGNQVLYSE